MPSKPIFLLSVAGCLALLTAAKSSSAIVTGSREWLNTVVGGFSARPLSASNNGCLNETWGGARNDCGSTVAVEMNPAITFPAGGLYTTHEFLRFYPVTSTALSCVAIYVVNYNLTDVGANETYWSSGWTTNNTFGVQANVIPGSPYMACQLPPGQVLQSVYIEGTDN